MRNSILIINWDNLEKIALDCKPISRLGHLMPELFTDQMLQKSTTIFLFFVFWNEEKCDIVVPLLLQFWVYLFSSRNVEKKTQKLHAPINFLKNEDIICAKKDCLEPKIARRQLCRHIILRIIIITISSFSKLHLFLRTFWH